MAKRKSSVRVAVHDMMMEIQPLRAYIPSDRETRRGYPPDNARHKSCEDQLQREGESERALEEAMADIAIVEVVCARDDHTGGKNVGDILLFYFFSSSPKYLLQVCTTYIYAVGISLQPKFARARDLLCIVAS